MRVTAATQGTGVSGDCGHLQRLVGLALSNRCGRPVEVVELSCEPSPYATLASIQVVTATLASGEPQRVLVKTTDPTPLGHPEKQRRDRERLIYERLLGDRALPVVDYYGASRNEATGQPYLVLEYIDDWNLKYQGIEIWLAAARRLAQLHLHFFSRRELLLGSDFLLRLDHPYLFAWAERAQQAVAERFPGLARRLDVLLDRYGAPVELLAAQPLTLVHNDVAPKNVIAVRSADPVRICFVDWELAGIGCGLLDLVHLKYGLEQRHDRAMCSAYVEEATGTGLIPDDPVELRRVIAACELHKTMYRLALSTQWALPIERVVEWVDDAERFHAEAV